MAEQGDKGRRVCTGFGARVTKGKEGGEGGWMGRKISFPSPLPTSVFLLMPSPLTAFPSLTSPPLFFRIEHGDYGKY